MTCILTLMQCVLFLSFLDNDSGDEVLSRFMRKIGNEAKGLSVS